MLTGMAASAALHLGVLLWPIDAPAPRTSRQGLQAPYRFSQRSIIVTPAPAASAAQRGRRSAMPGSHPGPPPPSTDSPSRRIDPEERKPRADDETGSRRRLEPRPGHSSLWKPTLDLLRPSEDLALERDMGRYRARKAWTDAAAAPREIPGMSTWTLESANSARWGLTPGTLHLGSLVVPLCLNGGTTAEDCGFGLLPSRREAFASWLGTYVDISRQSTRYRLEAEWGIRAAAMRARRDALRADTLERR